MNKRIILLLLWVLPLLAGAQSVTVPSELAFGGMLLRLTNGGQQAVQQKVDALRRHQPSFQARVDLADAYFPLIDRTFQAEGIPLDFRYLALQESGLQGEAQSIHDAVGYWQFKRESATELGVQVDGTVDERKHIVASSRGAAAYFKRNNATFRNWINTLLSYNLGLTGTKPYTLPTDVGATEMEISEKTHPYIITFLAHKIAYEPAVGLNPQPPMLLQEFPVQPGQRLEALAQTLQTDPTYLARHNYWLSRGSAVPAGKPYTVLVPITDELQRTALLANQRTATTGQLLTQPEIDPENADFVRINGLRAIVALPGDTKESLARRANLKMKRFMQYNDLYAFDNIVVGQPYFVQKKRDKSSVQYHVAQPGETVTTVGQKYGMRTRAILAKNRMRRTEELRPGRMLWLQFTRPREVAVEYVDSQDSRALAAFERPVSGSAMASTTTSQPAPTTPRRTLTPKAKTPVESTSTEPVELEQTAIIEEPQKDSVVVAVAAATPAPTATPVTQEEADLPPTAATPDTSRVKPQPTPPVKAAMADTVQTARQNLPPSQAQDTTRTSTVDTANAAEPVVKNPSQVVLRDLPASPKTAPAKSVPAKPTPAATSSSPRPVPASPIVTEATEVLDVPASGQHIVQKSESLYSIARRYGLRPADLAAWNNLPPNAALSLGQTLRVVPTVAAPAPKPAAPAATTPAPRPTTTPDKPATAVTPAPAATTGPIRHTVAAGESMYAISRKYGVTIKQIMEWNNKPDFNVRPGEVLTIRATK
ncbi:LysM peptidoglycan-binding domain-containing protein [Hymenobacter sp. BT188]|uniref:lytic transglycosylase domain-containing protein n=1 Tax=Hymenobacter sp. BT188 TaxID=2763504 RepID=UPI0016514816|nr:lytic transglycosylase domain-containing protein [Hymenobacter sp. BT188]MBC6606500.1 LysM peptidoglycan-binding domain-containing protein [Hymenobacter sp. BT188]